MVLLLTAAGAPGDRVVPEQPGDGSAGVTHDGPGPLMRFRPVVVGQLQVVPLSLKPVGAAALPVWLAW
jgi:hypothetical protein